MVDTDPPPAVAKPRVGLPGRLGLLSLFAVFLVATQQFLVGRAYGATLLHFTPFYNDEVDYWHETASFAAVGFRSGYYGVGGGELTAPAGFTHFGAHGPLFPAITGILGRVFGWQLYSSVIFNLSVVVVAIAVFVLATPLGYRRLGLLGLTLLTFWPLSLFLISNMQESLHQAIGILFAAILARMMIAGQGVGRRLMGLSLALLLLSALLRPSWMLLLPPLLWFGLRPQGRAARLALVIGFIGAAIWAEVAYNWLAAPYPNHMLAGGIEEIPRAASLLQGTTENIGRLATFRHLSLLEALQRVQVLGLLLLYTVAAIIGFKRRRPDRVVWFQLWNLGFIQCALIVTYLLGGYRDYRIMAPFLLITLLVSLAVSSRPWATMAVVAGNLLLAAPALGEIVTFHQPNFVYDTARLAQLRTELGRVIVYAEGAPARCNTLLTDTNPDPDLTAVPPAIGMTYALQAQNLPQTPKSRYLLLDRDGVSRYLVTGSNLRPLVSTPAGTVLQNDAVSCPNGS